MRQELHQAIADSVQQLYGQDVQIELTRPDAQFGDYATNVALQLAKQVGKSPKEIAEEIVSKLEHEAIQEAAIAGPGFINIRLSDAALVRELANAKPQPHIGQVVVIETNNPNPFKEMHIGHGYNSIIADTMANLLEAGGAEVHRVSYHGDIGAHVGKSMWSILKAIENDPSKLDEIAPEDRGAFMNTHYAAGATAYNDDPAKKVEIDELAKQSFVPEGIFKEVYEKTMAWSFDDITRKVALLGSKSVERKFLESEADALGVKTVHEHTGKVFTESQGAIIFDGEPYKLHTEVFVASNGNGLYAARDLGLMQLKNEAYHPNKSYIVTGNEQRAYFNVVLRAASLALPDLANQTVNTPTGLVKLSTGKMSSRTGDVVNIDWLFEQIGTAMEAQGGSADNRDTLVGALRYAFLKVRVGGDVVFDVNEALSLQGNSGPYLQYAYARANSVLAKANVLGGELTDLEPAERDFVRKLTEFTDAEAKAYSELLPHHITTYLYELSQQFNSFYEHNRVIGDPRELTRLTLVQRYRETLREGLTLLGIPTPERM